MIWNILLGLADLALFWRFTALAMQNFAEGKYGIASFYVLADLGILFALKKTFEEE